MNRNTAFPGASAVLNSSDRTWTDLPVPGRTGNLTATVLNRDLRHGPFMAEMRMAAGSRIPTHYHERTAEDFLVLEGEFINAGIAYGPGTFFAVAVGDVHGPHETRTGCTLLFVQAVEVDPTDFYIAE